MSHSAESLQPYEPGTPVAWKWGAHEAYGEIEEVHTSRVERVIKGSRIVRNGTPERPAYLIRQENGQTVLKLHTELEAFKP
ncbi:MAG: DUF2945 domain-containing protein [Vampirovibrionales bacterium]|nr:DUF2945 domain-containing protein [Vampirovibrionales bacterium]